MQYITLFEKGGADSPNIGTVAVNENLMTSIAKALEAHFDGTILTPIDEEEVRKCLNSDPIEMDVEMEINGDEYTHEVEFSQTWLYQ